MFLCRGIVVACVCLRMRGPVVRSVPCFWGGWVEEVTRPFVVVLAGCCDECTTPAVEERHPDEHPPPPPPAVLCLYPRSAWCRVRHSAQSENHNVVRCSCSCCCGWCWWWCYRHRRLLRGNKPLLSWDSVGRSRVSRGWALLAPRQGLRRVAPFVSWGRVREFGTGRRFLPRRRGPSGQAGSPASGRRVTAARAVRSRRLVHQPRLADRHGNNGGSFS